MYYILLLKGRTGVVHIKKNFTIPLYEKKFSLTIVFAASFEAQHLLFILSG